LTIHLFLTPNSAAIEFGHNRKIASVNLCFTEKKILKQCVPNCGAVPPKILSWQISEADHGQMNSSPSTGWPYTRLEQFSPKPAIVGSTFLGDFQPASKASRAGYEAHENVHAMSMQFVCLDCRG
jgi:hypothetical protein